MEYETKIIKLPDGRIRIELIKRDEGLNDIADGNLSTPTGGKD